jgi:anti-sigma B factor antagonist
MYAPGFSGSSARRECTHRRAERDFMSQPEGSSRTPGPFHVKLQTHRRTALIELLGELDIATVAKVGQAFDTLNLDVDGFRHVVLDLRGVTFMDCRGVHELERQRDHADRNRHNLAVVRGHGSVSRVMALTRVDESLVLVESPEDLSPPNTPDSSDAR